MRPHAIHSPHNSVRWGKEPARFRSIEIVVGANIAGFRKVAEAMLEQGIV